MDALYNKKATCKACRRKRKLDPRFSKCARCMSSIETVTSAHNARYQGGQVPTNGPIVRRQMFANFFETYLPPTSALARRLSYLRAIMDTSPEKSSPLVNRALETVCLAHGASSGRDQRLLYGARLSYDRVLKMLRLALSSSLSTIGTRIHRDIITSICLLSHINEPLSGSEQSQDVWATHIEGVQNILAARGPLCLDFTSALDVGLIRHSFFWSFFLAVAKRKAWNLTLPAGWLQVRAAGWTGLISTFHTLPALLERADKILKSSRSGSEDARLLEILISLHEIKRASTGLWADVDEAKTVAVTDADAFDMRVEEECFVTSSKAFKNVFVPLSETDTARMGHRTFLLLILESTVLRIWHFAPRLKRYASLHQQQATEKSAFSLAVRLCMTLLSYSTRQRSLAHAQCYRMYVQLARNVFEEQRALPELGWCYGCLIANHLRIQRLRSAPTLCRVEDITPGIAEAGRYKSKFNEDAFVMKAYRASQCHHRTDVM